MVKRFIGQQFLNQNNTKYLLFNFNQRGDLLKDQLKIFFILDFYSRFCRQCQKAFQYLHLHCLFLQVLPIFARQSSKIYQSFTYQQNAYKQDRKVAHTMRMDEIQILIQKKKHQMQTHLPFTHQNLMILSLGYQVFLVLHGLNSDIPITRLTFLLFKDESSLYNHQDRLLIQNQ
ncbi:hypothetical protein TTHERM_000691228 (macronuclear) [Tetrahymena thermophila SB210]|uniref:Uncharacterized protein n=1 Tax=Tetrahymena thermophila (strain SB210) TaxID=312017 RepID=W7X422_TETTS|nr:hypothetical protein TTHERM_000691228 [Tetrahymena thermophila SB210]EWS72182.1 hypothetical protein TTHERM_000691228 [Tetrahymena thermophila SB210]|eukprot:XP_012655275.1 hypothetical protein TTHERM_000691228 [Tetrahymena thermophila SB210]